MPSTSYSGGRVLTSMEFEEYVQKGLTEFSFTAAVE